MLTSEVQRWMNAGLTTLILAGFVVATMVRWHEYARRADKAVDVAVIGLLAAVAYGSGEAASQHSSTGVRVVALTASLVVLAAALAYLLAALRRQYHK